MGDPGRNYWMDITRPDSNILSHLQKVFNLQRTNVRDIYKGEGIPTFDSYDSHIVLCLEGGEGQCAEGVFSPSSFINPVYVVYSVENDIVMSFHNQTAPLFDRFFDRAQTEFSPIHGPDATLQGHFFVDWALFLLFDEISTEFNEEINGAGQEINSISELLETLKADEYSDVRRRIISASKLLSALQDSIGAHQQATSQLLNNPSLFESTRVCFGKTDLLLHAFTERIELLDQLLDSIQSSYLGHLQLELGQSADRLNVVMSRLAVVNLIMLPLTVVSAFFGMNVWYPLRVEQRQDYAACGLVLGICVVLATVTCLILWRLGMFK
eukprot:TRINITY_DN11460_c0_g1_i1.p1 TRINITY_DN11460_c0_g1~~TRINITY_DN11460_c0_g1_i1.p1  ORF type:complete len:371 (+),score=65.04 TRINITY_DN11460_c0_g1_i1:141-1115(+)